jgi:uncharacterized protein YbjQ (UPF0145 family)
MKGMMISILLGMVMLIGCKSYLHLSVDRSSTSDIPFERRKPASANKAIIISTNGPQLEPKYYEVMGKVMSQVENMTSLENHCMDAMEMLRHEAEKVGADALINVSCTPDKYSANASGTAIAFRNSEETLKVLRDIKAVLE